MLKCLLNLFMVTQTGEVNLGLNSRHHLPSGSGIKGEMVWFLILFQLQLNFPNRPIWFEFFSSTEHKYPPKTESQCFLYVRILAET